MKGELQDRHYFRQRLIEEQEALRERVQRMDDSGLRESMSESVGELSSYDQHPADAGAEMLEREKDFGMRAQAKASIEDIDEALERIEAGTYGVCTGCGEKIPIERLEALPTARECVSCASEHRRGSDRPAEEQISESPFLHSFTDGTENVGYDGEDTWQDLAEFGTANTPQDDTLYPKGGKRSR